MSEKSAEKQCCRKVFESGVTKEFCGEVLEKSLVRKGGVGALQRSVVQTCCREVRQECCAEMSEKRIVETYSERRVLFAREVLKKSERHVGDECRRGMLYRSVGEE